jgi:hypothetical protein
MKQKAIEALGTLAFLAIYGGILYTIPHKIDAMKQRATIERALQEQSDRFMVGCLARGDIEFYMCAALAVQP